MTRVGSEVTGGTPALPSLSVSVPVPDLSNPMSPSDRPIAWQVLYVCANGMVPVPSGTGPCVSVHDPKVMVPLSTGPLLGVKMKVVPSSPNARVVDWPGKPKSVPSGKVKVSPLRAAAFVAVRFTVPSTVTVALPPVLQPRRAKELTRTKKTVQLSPSLGEYQCRIVSSLF